MVKSSLRTLPVAVVGATVLAQLCGLPALRAAVSMATIAMSADEEQTSALVLKAEPKTEYNFAMCRHELVRAALDKHNRFVAP
jgi:ABC-type branched-subunit amino acid transport system permease subunit